MINKNIYFLIKLPIYQMSCDDILNNNINYYQILFDD